MLQSIILYFVPESLRTNVDEFRRARLIVNITFTLILISSVNAIQISLTVGWAIISTLMMLSIAACILGLFLLKRLASARFSGNYLTIIFLTIISLLCYFSNSGLQGGRVQPFFLAAPMIAALANGKISAWSYLLVSTIIVSIFFVLNMNDYPFPPSVLPQNLIFRQQFIALVFLMILVTALVIQFISAKDEALGMVDALRTESTRKAQEDYQKLIEVKAENERQAAQTLATSEAQKQYLASSIDTLLQHIRRVSDGDLTVRVPVQSQDDIGKLAGTLNQTIEIIEQMLARVADSADRTVATVHDISAATEGLANSATNQSMQATQVAGAVEQMSATIEQTTQQTSLAAHEASLANDDANHGGSAMKTMMENVRQVAAVVIQSADKISALGKLQRTDW